ncbi:MAG: AMP-binding protein [Candidatus Aminicenantes bacterium]|nr:MAG: AMP-binding protein [Candidatus Aminicenantes bacterium]
MRSENISGKAAMAANQNIKERDYWLKKLSGELTKTCFPYDFKNKRNLEYGRPGETGKSNAVTFKWTGDFFSYLMRVSSGSDPRLHMILVAGTMALLYKYTGSSDIIVGTPVYKQAIDAEFINTVLALRNQVKGNMTFKDLLLQVRQTIVEADENQDYPIEILIRQLKSNPAVTQEDFPLFDVVILLENLQDKKYLRQVNPNSVFSFLRTDGHVQGVLEYNSRLYNITTVKRLIDHFKQLLQEALRDVNLKISNIEILSKEEKKQVLFEFNNTDADYPKDKTIHELFERQVTETPDNIAVLGGNGWGSVTYGELNEKADRWARVLRRNGVIFESIVGIMMEPSPGMIIALAAILKAGAAYLPIPIDSGLPGERLNYMLEDSNVKVLIADEQTIKGISFTSLVKFEANRDIRIVKTAPRKHIKEFDRLPIPDRSLIDPGNYKDKIGMASVFNCISIQATRGCPYECLFCHKVWSKNHAYRSAENIYHEIEYYHRKGVRNFAIIDDCFNLSRANSSRFYKLLIQNKLDLQLFFPNGLRGDILSPEDIDLMVEAGCRGINLSLETASPRLQKLVKKNLDIDKLKAIMDYIAGKHPDIILEIATMHGFPTETEEEALMTLDFVKSIKWLHFPYIHILKIYPNTEMERFALDQGISQQDILASRNLAYHELPETLPFPKSFTRKYQADFMNDYFLSKERLKQVLPVQMKIMAEKAIVDKYNAYLPVEITNIEDILRFVRIDDMEIPARRPVENISSPTLFAGQPPRQKKIPPGAKKILFLDLGQHFSSHSMLYNVSEQPLGLISLLTYLKQEFADKIDGRIYKSGIDFDSYKELKLLLDDYKPHLVGIRTLTFYREFFHQTVSLLRNWGVDAPIIAGGPYATSDYNTILKDKNVDLIVLGEGEYTLAQLIEKMLENDFKLPSRDILRQINGIAFVENHDLSRSSRNLLVREYLFETPGLEESGNIDPIYPGKGNNLAYVMYTSGSTGKPKGVMVEHRQVNNCISWMQDKFNLGERDVIVQRTNLTFDPSVWEIFWPLYIGAGIKVLTTYQSKDAEFLIQLLAENGNLTMMYCPSTLIKAMTDLVNSKPVKPVLELPWLLIGAEPIASETIQSFYSFFKGRIVNTYGPTECTINNTYYELEPCDERTVVPIGKPIANNRVYILSGDLQPMPIGTPGEIYIAGDSVARGYINKPGLTGEKFDHDLWDYQDDQDKRKKLPGKRIYVSKKIYKTGDRGQWLEDGTIEIMGRSDEQVKVRGYRVELGEIEAALLEHGSIKECVAVAKKINQWKEEIKVCKRCGIGTNYPGVTINDDGNCEICENLIQYKKPIEEYFKSLQDLEDLIKKENKNKKGKYDCLLLYSGGRGSAYALYQLKDMGFNVLAVTYDNGYFSKSDLENIRKITSSVHVDHIVLKHKNSDKILKESIKTAHTVCRGCFHTSASLAAQHAYKNGINVVVGATLSRGQIIENKLFMFIRQGITGLKELEKEVANLRKVAHDIDKTIFDYIDIDLVKEDSLDQRVKFVDFYRYCDISNKGMIAYLNNRDPYWRTRKNYAIYSTNCPIKQVGDYGHLKRQGYHYYGSATSWEKRLGHITLKNLEEDLQCRVKETGYENFLKRLGIPDEASPDPTNDDSLIVYFVSHQELEVHDLREYLLKKLPAYMIPNYFEPIEKIPLTPNGKVDKGALPKPVGKSKPSAEYQEPENEVEEKLVEVWHEVLARGRGKIGTNDNFFELGGDSIKAIQISAKLQKYGLKMEIKDLFLNPTIKALAKSVSTLDRVIPQGIVEGEVELTPIQHWFFENHFTQRHHFNQALILSREKGFDEEKVKKLFTRIVEHHDALRMVFKKEPGNVKQINRGLTGNLIDLSVYDLREEERYAEIIEEKCNQLQRSMDLKGEGALLRLGLFKTGTINGDYLLIAIHHLVVDGVSWRILLEDLSIGYSQLENGEEVRFQDKTHSFQYWAHKLKEYSYSDKALQELEYWKGIEAAVTEPLPKDLEPGKEKKKNRYCETINMNLGKEETRKLLKEVNQAFNTEINDILLTALGLALNQWAGLEKVLVNLEGHGREPIVEEVNISRTIGWYTTQFPVILDITTGENLAHQIKSIKETLRQIPNKGIGYGILRYLTPQDKKQGICFEIEPGIRFNYLGQLGGEINRGPEVFKISAMKRGDDISPQAESPYTLDINGAILGEQLGLSITYNKEAYHNHRVEKLLDYYKANLVKIIEYCTAAEETEKTVSDFDAVDLDAEEVGIIYQELGLD